MSDGDWGGWAGAAAPGAIGVADGVGWVPAAAGWPGADAAVAGTGSGVAPGAVELATEGAACAVPGVAAGTVPVAAAGVAAGIAALVAGAAAGAIAVASACRGWAARPPPSRWRAAYHAPAPNPPARIKTEAQTTRRRRDHAVRRACPKRTDWSTVGTCSSASGVVSAGDRSMTRSAASAGAAVTAADRDGRAGPSPFTATRALCTNVVVVIARSPAASANEMVELAWLVSCCCQRSSSVLSRDAALRRRDTSSPSSSRRSAAR